jgi:hypothetical protein
LELNENIVAVFFTTKNFGNIYIRYPESFISGLTSIGGLIAIF